jgi:phage shock protein C
MRQRLYRSIHDRRIAGVCGGLAEAWDLDPSLVRIAWVILTILTGGILLVVYIAMAIIVPEGPPGWTAPWPSDRYSAPRSWADWNAAPSSGPGSPSAFATGPGWSGSAPESAGTGVPSTGAAPGPAEMAGEPAASTAAWMTGATGEPATSPAAPPPPAMAPPAPVPWPPHGSESWRARWDAERPHRHGIGGIVFGLILVLVGGAFLLRQAIPSIDFDVLWPVVVIVLGVVLIAAAFFPQGGGRGDN